VTEHLLSDDQIAALTPAQRRHLISRLQPPLDGVLPAPLSLRMRYLRMTIIGIGVIVLIPWMMYLAVTLPQNYAVHGWPMTWVGFDVLLVAFMTATLVLGYLRRQLGLFMAFTTGVLLICDAWFDTTTAEDADLLESVLSAVFVELPVAVLMIGSTLRLLRVTLTRLWILEPGTRLWQLPLIPRP
jgi:hypothetical protein